MSLPDYRLVIDVLLASGHVRPEDVEGVATALNDAFAEGHDEPAKLVAAASRIWNLRRGLVPLFVVIDEYLEFQRFFFANTDEVACHIRRCDPAWKPRVIGFAWVSPDKVHDYLISNPARPYSPGHEVPEDAVSSQCRARG